MQVHFGVETIDPEWAASVVCLGTFDGVHLGHQAVVGRAVDKAAKEGLPCVLVTFDRHPAATLKPESCPPSVASLSTNLREFQTLGVGFAVVLAFTKSFSETSADDFLRGTLVAKIKASEIVIGHDFAFGHNRQGTADWLATKIKTVVVQPVLLEGERVSSSAIRQAIAQGNVEFAQRQLGRPFELEGIVIEGDKLGRTIGYPTINLARAENLAVPNDGVYAGDCLTLFGNYKAAISVGNRPTVNGKKRTIEAFLLDYPGTSLYGRNVVLRFARRLRGQEKFSDLESMQQQIERDVAETARIEVAHGR